MSVSEEQRPGGYHYAPTRLTEQEQRLLLLSMEDDTEEAPWMVMGEAQYWSATQFASVLNTYARSHHLSWYVVGMLPILYPRSLRRKARKGQVAPDVLMARVPQRRRQSYDLEEEGIFPEFVLEVLSSSSAERDQEDKVDLYEVLGAREYVLFAPDAGPETPVLQGYRRGPDALFEPWPLDSAGRLWSETLGLYLVVEGDMLRALQRDGQPLLMLTESEAARAESEAARLAAEEGRQQEAAARRRAEEELAQLRAMLEQGRDEG